MYGKLKLTRLNILWVALTLMFFVLGCADSDDDSSGSSHQSLDGSSYSVVSGSGLTHGSTYVAGNGSVVFVNSLGSLDGKKSFALSFSLQDGGKITLHAFTTNKLADGINIDFERSGTTLLSSIQMTGTGGISQSLNNNFNAINASENLSIQIDTHNDETPAHILIWNGNSTPFTEGNSLVNTEDLNPNPWTTEKGQGTFYGITLKDATIDTVTVSGPKFQD